MTTIEWVRGSDGSEGKSWNALRAQRIFFDGTKMIPVSANHCERVNDACRFCYADSMNRRLHGLPFKPGHRKDYLAFVVDEKKLVEPLRRKKPTRIFVESMSDAFGEWWPDEFIDKLYAVMALTPQHTYINLSKRPERRRQYLDDPDLARRVNGQIWSILGTPEGKKIKHGGNWRAKFPLCNVIEGTSVSNQREADEFVPILLRTSAAVRCLSCEPLLGPIDLTRICLMPQKPGSVRAGIHLNTLAGRYCESGVRYTGAWDVNGPAPSTDTPALKLDWVIVGGESGRKARPTHPNWVRSLRDQCAAASVSFFMKQWGQWVTEDQSPEDITLPSTSHLPWAKGVNGNRGDQTAVYSVGKGKAGRLLDGREHNEFPRIAA